MDSILAIILITLVTIPVAVGVGILTVISIEDIIVALRLRSAVLGVWAVIFIGVPPAAVSRPFTAC